MSRPGSPTGPVGNAEANIVEEVGDNSDVVVNAVAYGAVSTASTVLLALASVKALARHPYRDGQLHRRGYIRALLNGNPTECMDQLRMGKLSFRRLCVELCDKKLLDDTRRMTLEEQVVMFLHTLGHNVRNRVIGSRFSRSGETVSRHFNRVLNAILKLYDDYVKPPTCDTPTEIATNPNWASYFEDCVGALDGTHIPAYIPLDEQPPFRDRKGMVTQNVMAACSFDLRFVYVYAGWEGAASDARVLQSCLNLEEDSVPLPEGKYYLVDAGYAHRPGFMAPYRGSRYHLNEFRSGREPRDPKELFNYRHSALRSAIERAFGLLKNRFPILRNTPPYPFPTQVKLVVACCILHNFIMDTGEEIIRFEGRDNQDTVERDSPVERQLLANFTPAQREEWKEKRDVLANRMWADWRLTRAGQ